MALMEKERSMLIYARLSQEFWVEAMDIACYLVNQFPTSTLVGKTPHVHVMIKMYLSWTSQSLWLYAYVHVLKENKIKLDNDVDKCIFTGYNDGIKGYKLWNPITNKMLFIVNMLF